MNKERYFKQLETNFNQALDLMKRKNQDYAGAVDPFKNFRLCESLGITLEEGLLVRMSDKLARIGNLLKNEAKVSDESICDTVGDLMNYSAILLVWLQERSNRDLE